jgi:hypothetical protein
VTVGATFPEISGQAFEVIFEEVRAGTICKFENDVLEDRVRKRLAEEALEAVGWRQETTTTQRPQGCELHALRIQVRLPAARAAHVAKELRAREMVICHSPIFGIEVHVATERNISTAEYKMMREFGARTPIWVVLVLRINRILDRVHKRCAAPPI